MRKFIITALMLALSSPVFAHAVVRTEAGSSESLVGKSETYRLNVPVEKEIATTEIRMLVPAGVVIRRFMQTPGWVRTLEKDSSNAVTAVVWKGTLEPMEFARFLFSATNPAKAGELSWIVFQKYADGTVVAWDDANKDQPASKITLK